MRVSIIGTGYVGLVSGVCLAEKGHEVVCVDVDGEKIDRINRGVTPIGGACRPASEPRIQQPLPSQRAANRPRRRAEHACELMTQRGVVAIAEVHRELEERPGLRTLQKERGANSSRYLKPVARRR